MKVTHILLFLFIFNCLYSQNLETYYSGELLDSTYYFEFVQNEYELTDKYYIIERTPGGETLNAIQFRFDSIENIWINRYSDTIKYFEDLSISESIRKYWDNDNNEWIDCEYSKWNPEGKILDTYSISRIYGIPYATYGNRYINIYDENGNLIENIRKVCGDNLIWNVVEIKEYEYDEYNRLKTYIFNSITKWEYLYNEDDFVNEIFISLKHLNKWDTTWHHFLSYSNDSLIEDLTYHYLTNMKVARDTFLYDLNEKIKLRKYEHWDTLNSNWFTDVILKYQYNQDNKIIEYANINSYGGDWEFFRLLYDYDLKGNLIEYKRQSGDSTNIVNEWRYNYSYNDNDHLLIEEYQIFENESWINQLKQNNYWSGFSNIHNIEKNTIGFEVYPNPCRNHINLVNHNLISYKLNIYELSGKLMFSEDIETYHRILNIHESKSGIYIFQFSNKYGIETQKIIIE